MEVIDIHVHGRAEDPFAQMEETLRLAEAAGIGRLCVLGGGMGKFGHRPTDADIRAINDITIGMTRRWPERIVGFCFLNPGLGRRFVAEETRRCLDGAGLRGFKLSVAVNARSPRVDPVMRAAEARGLPVLYHTWYKTANKYPNESDPSDIACLAARFPDVRIIMAHLTAAGVRGVLDVRPFPNVFVDTSGCQGFAGIVEYAVAQLGAERVVFGSDVPGRDFPVQLGRVLGARLTERHRRMVLGGNAKRLLGLGGGDGDAD